LYSSPDVTEVINQGGCGGREKYIQNIVTKTFRKGFTRTWDDNIKMDLKDLG
jgi:hypothetical protein